MNIWHNVKAVGKAVGYLVLAVVLFLVFFTYLTIGSLASIDTMMSKKWPVILATKKSLYNAHDPSIAEMSRSDLDSLKLSMIDHTKTDAENLMVGRSLLREMYGDTKAWELSMNPSFIKLAERAGDLNNTQINHDKHFKGVQFRIEHRPPYSLLVQYPWLNIAYPISWLFERART